VQPPPRVGLGDLLEEAQELAALANAAALVMLRKAMIAVSVSSSPLWTTAGSRPRWIIAAGPWGTPGTTGVLTNAGDVASRTDVTAGPSWGRAQRSHEAAFARVCRPAAST
jgi:hypothetical protein